MKSRSHPLLLATLFGLLLAAAAILLAARPAQAALPAAGVDRGMLAADGATTGDDILWAPEEMITVTVLTLNLSNEAPGHLIDSLIARGRGDETLFELLGYLQAQSGGVISDTFYNDVANAPPWSEVFTAHLSNYAGLDGLSVEIGANGKVHIRHLVGSAYACAPGYAIAPSQDGRFTLTYAQDADHYIWTGIDFSHGPPGTTTQYNYYAFAIAWSEGDSVFLPLVARNP